ncbi:MAG: hypothetical protein ACI8WM_001147 [Burkholderiaceae bacterium]|jgi:hypothetical protein
MIATRTLTFPSTRRGMVAALCLALVSTLASAGDIEAPVAKMEPEPLQLPKTFSKKITDRLGVKNVAYLLVVDVNGNVVPFVPEEPKSSFRIIDPSREKLTMDLFDITPFTIVAGKRNPFCVVFVGGSARKLWMESCP